MKTAEPFYLLCYPVFTCAQPCAEMVSGPSVAGLQAHEHGPELWVLVALFQRIADRLQVLEIIIEGDTLA